MQTNRVSIDDVLREADWFLDDMGTRDGACSFAKVSPEILAAQPFLAQNWDRSQLPKVRLDAPTVLARMAPAKPVANFIWHTGFCCSTLLTRALEVPDRHVCLREPQVMLILAELKRYHYFDNGRLDPRLLDAALRLLCRPFTEGGRVTLKPANAASFLIRDAAARVSGRMLFLYSDCRSFLTSIAKRNEHGMRFARRGFGIVAGDGNAAFNWPMDEVMQLTDLRIAALYWHMQIGEFLRSLPALAPGTVASLDCDAFLADPAGTVEKLNRFLELDLPARHARSVAGVMSHDAKSPALSYTPARRRAEYDRIARDLGEDLDEIVAWSYEVSPQTPRGVPVPNALAMIEKSYHP